MKKAAVFGMLTCAALMLSYLESLIGLTPRIPGIRLGLPNLVTVFCLYRYGIAGAAAVNVSRIFLSAFLFGNPYAFLYSMAGALFSMTGMELARRLRRFSVVGVSILGGVLHNVAQLLTAMAVVETVWVAGYLPWLLLAGGIAGGINGLLAGEALKRVPKGEI